MPTLELDLGPVIAPRPNITAARTEFVYTCSLKSDKEVCAIEFPEPAKGRLLVAAVGFAGLPRPS